MRVGWPSRLIVIAAASAIVAGFWAHGPRVAAQSAAVAPAQPARPVDRAASGTALQGRYVGSPACQHCHQDEFASWHKTLHVQMTKPIEQALIVGDFGPGAHLEQYGRAFRMETRDGRYFISVSHDGGPFEKFEVHYTLGARRFQGYLSKLSDGRIYVLPVFWHNENKRWVDWKEITPVPDDPSHDLRQIWNVTCVNCHATNLVKNYSMATNTYATTWAEMGIGCEACHGPGEGHVALMEAWKRDPALKPKYDDSAKNRDLSRVLRIFSPRSASPRQVFDACGYCHGNKNNAFFGFRPGDRYEDFALPFLMSEPIPPNDPQGDFWPDGRPSRFNRPQALMLTGCFQQGQATCTTCHTAHGSKNDHALKVPVEVPGQRAAHTKQSDLLCTQCHVVGGAPAKEPAAVVAETTAHGGGAAAATPIPDLAAHTRHAPDSPGSRCVTCHMSDVNWRLFTRRLDHTFQPPVPEMTARFGVPNACTTCHEDRSPEWAASIMDQWYTNGDRRRAVVAVADVMYKAGAGDAGALPDVARLAVDRRHGALIRASAAEFADQMLRRLPDGAAIPSGVTNPLLGAASDPEPMVRAKAVRALGVLKDPRLVSVLVAHLTDEVRLVRTAAAESLLRLNVSRLDGPAGTALTRAQGEWIESLKSFGDLGSHHTTLGWLESELGQGDEAAKDLRFALTLNPNDASAHVYLGVLAARAGKYEQAIQHWRTAKSLGQGAYANLDRLIEEARKRSQNRS